MNTNEARQFISDLYLHLLKRGPAPDELTKWTDLVVQSLRPDQIVRAFINSKEYNRRQAVTSLFAPGHYHSPVVDPATVREYFVSSQSQSLEDLAGIEINLEAMLEFWNDNLAFTQSAPFTQAKSIARRFFYDGSPYPWGDAITLRTMINVYRPTRIIEIGSGFSTACMLDSADECGHSAMRITCIEPYPDRLHSLLRPVDYDCVDVIPTGIQEVRPKLFDELEANDILFIDSTHVLKTGSDVHFELFSVLPRLRPGVLVHVHDCPFPFEYPEKWVFDLNYSWNEAYALRAFLMYNQKFSVFFWNSALARRYRAKMMQDSLGLMLNAGTAIWLVVNKL